MRDIEVNYMYTYIHELEVTDGATASAFAMMMADYTQRLLGEDNKDWTLEIIEGYVAFGFKHAVNYKIHVQIAEALLARVRDAAEGDSGDLTDEEGE